MRGFDLDGGAFFLCTETSPRCFIIQQVNDVDGALKEVQQQQQISTGSSGSDVPSHNALSASARRRSFCHSASPFLPMLPWWFTADCRQHLLSVTAPLLEEQRAGTPDTRPSSSIGGAPISQEQLRHRIQRQLEYYFSRENLINDRYLRCQMDADQYVPIKIVANFPKITQLSKDLDLIIDVLKASSHVQVDESGQKVRPVSKRCTIILREIPENANENEVKSMFGEGCPPFRSLFYGLNDSWYVTFATEEDTQKAFFHLQTIGKTFNGKPVFARIKTGGAPVGADMHGAAGQESGNYGGIHNIQLGGGALRGQLIVHHPQNFYRYCETPEPTAEADKQNNGEENKNGGMEKERKEEQQEKLDLGRILAQFGYVPRATFKPNLPGPASAIQSASSMPPLQPTSNSVVSQPTSFFVQPIIHNDEFIFHDHRHVHPLFPRYRPPLLHRHNCQPRVISLRINTPSSDYRSEEDDYEEDEETADQQYHFQRTNGGSFNADDDVGEDRTEGREDCGSCYSCVYGGSCLMDVVSDGENEVNGGDVAWRRRSRKRSRRRAFSEPATFDDYQIAVGQNEFVLRQRAKEGANLNRDPNIPLPSPVPRITDVPRLTSAMRDGKQSSAKIFRGESIVGTKDRSAKYDRPPIGGGGFQRQQSVEAYQMAVAANGIGKAAGRKMAAKEMELERMGGEWEAVGGRKGAKTQQRNNSMGGTPQQQQQQFTKTTRTHPPKLASSAVRLSTDHPPPRILGSSIHHMRSLDQPFHSPPIRPLNDSANCPNWRQNSYPNSTTARDTAISQTSANEFNNNNSSNHHKIQRSNGPLAQWTMANKGRGGVSHHQFPVQPMSRAQPLLSLTSSAFSSLGPPFQQSPRGVYGEMNGGGRGKEREGGQSGRGRMGWEESGREREGRKAMGRRGRGREADEGTRTDQQQYHLFGGYNTISHHRPGIHRQQQRHEERGEEQTTGRRGTGSEAGRATQQRWEQLDSYNFVEREFPALLGGGSELKNGADSVTTFANSGGTTTSIGTTSAATTTTLSSIRALKFSAVVAGNGRRRATIGGGRTLEDEAEAERTSKAGGGAETQSGRQQQRSGTISGMREDERSYAQMLMKSSQNESLVP